LSVKKGINWFLADVFPTVHTLFPDITFHFAGKSMPDSYQQYQSNGIFCYGEVPDAKSFMNNYDILIVPLHHASGLRIKILEAMAMGIPVICTTKAAQGIPCMPGIDILLAETVDSFCDAIRRLHSEESLYNKLSTNGIMCIQQHFSMEFGKNSLQDFLESFEK